MRNEIAAVPFERDGEDVELSLTLEPLESVLLVFQPEVRALPRRHEPSAEPARLPIPVVREAAVASSVPAAPAPGPRIQSGGSRDAPGSGIRKAIPPSPLPRARATSARP